MSNWMNVTLLRHFLVEHMMRIVSAQFLQCENSTVASEISTVSVQYMWMYMCWLRCQFCRGQFYFYTFSHCFLRAGRWFRAHELQDILKQVKAHIDFAHSLDTHLLVAGVLLGGLLLMIILIGCQYANSMLLVFFSVCFALDIFCFLVIERTKTYNERSTIDSSQTETEQQFADRSCHFNEHDNWT